MKKPLLHLLTGAFALASFAAAAQPTLTATGCNPVVGETFTLYTAAYTSPGSAGAGQTWDLSALAGSTAGLTTNVTPASTVNGASFTNANVAWDNSTASTDNYFKTTSTMLQNYGVVSGGTVIPYSDPEDMMHFPCAYSAAYSDPWAGQFVSSGYTFYRYGTTTVTADGWGTLITPAGTFTNVMRIHFVQVYKDSANVGIPYVITYNNDEYIWYRNATHAPLASMYTLTSSAGGPYTGASYLFSGAVGITESGLISASSVYPNPANSLLSLAITLKQNKNVEVKIFNSIGQQMNVMQAAEGVQGMNTMELNVAELPEGIYFAQIMLDGNLAETKRFVVNR